MDIRTHSRVMLPELEYTTSKQMFEHILGGNNFSCRCFHQNESSCVHRSMIKAWQVTLSLLKINIPIHLIPLIIFKFKALIQRPQSTIPKLLINMARSVMFLASFVQTVFAFQCYGNYLFSSWSIRQLSYLSFIFSGFGIAFEQPHKRVEITLYCIPKTLEAIWNFFEKRNLVKTIPFQSAITFAVSMGILALAYGDGSNPKTVRGFSLKTCRNLWSDTDNVKKDKEQ